MSQDHGFTSDQIKTVREKFRVAAPLLLSPDNFDSAEVRASTQELLRLLPSGEAPAIYREEIRKNRKILIETFDGILQNLLNSLRQDEGVLAHYSAQEAADHVSLATRDAEHYRSVAQRLAVLISDVQNRI